MAWLFILEISLCNQAVLPSAMIPSGRGSEAEPPLLYNYFADEIFKRYSLYVPGRAVSLFLGENSQ